MKLSAVVSALASCLLIGSANADAGCGDSSVTDSPATAAPTQATEYETPAPTTMAPNATSGGFTRFFNESAYKATFPDQIALYAFQGFVDATDAYPAFANSGNDDNDKRELAAFLAQTSHESDYFKAAEEYAAPTYNESQYCDPTTIPCAKGHRYHGRGPIQLSWNYNYYHAGEALGLDLLNNPEFVGNTSSIAWMTALWYWMTPQGGRVIHDEVTGVDGFANSTDIINGALECGGPNQANELQRIKYYGIMCDLLDVQPLGKTSCNA